MRGWLLLALMVGTTLAAVLTESGASETSACARGYSPCLPIVGDLDCDQISDAKKPIRVTGADAYGLDRDRDGLGCEVLSGGGRQSPWGLILRKGRKEATNVRVGDTLTVVGWSPRVMKGKPYQLCVTRTNGVVCEDSNAYALNGTVPEKFGTWKVARGEGRRGVFKLSLKVQGRIRASDTVPLRY